jgi:hypothetical protein
MIREIASGSGGRRNSGREPRRRRRGAAEPNCRPRWCGGADGNWVSAAGGRKRRAAERDCGGRGRGGGRPQSRGAAAREPKASARGAARVAERAAPMRLASTTRNATRAARGVPDVPPLRLRRRWRRRRRDKERSRRIQTLQCCAGAAISRPAQRAGRGAGCEPRRGTLAAATAPHAARELRRGSRAGGRAGGALPGAASAARGKRDAATRSPIDDAREAAGLGGGNVDPRRTVSAQDSPKLRRPLRNHRSVNREARDDGALGRARATKPRAGDGFGRVLGGATGDARSTVGVGRAEVAISRCACHSPGGKPRRARCRRARSHSFSRAMQRA